jgi:molybdenum cofactor cytidylyltransferase
MADIAAILLAAGQATRFDAGPQDTKLAAEFQGKPLVVHVAAAALASRAVRLVVVTGHAAGKVLSALAGLDFFEVHNPAFAQGLSSSLKAGIAALPPDVKGVVILLADMPFVTAGLIDQLIGSFEEAAVEPDAVVPIRGGQRGNPVLIGRKLFSEVDKLEGDRGAAAILKERTRLVVEYPVDDAAIEIDIDTRLALDELRTMPP